jgi:hypothetical protein
MKRYLFILLVSVAATCAADIEAMPLAPIVAPELTISVASGCGLGVHRGPFDGCEPVYGAYYPGFYHGYRNNYYAGFGRGGQCGGRGTHLACSLYGICWLACN